jgi:hypothetical protein
MASLNYIYFNGLLIFISGENLSVIEDAAKALYWIATQPGGAQIAVAANVLHCMAELLESPNEEVRKWRFNILRELVHHGPTARVVVGQVVPLLRRVSIISL